MNFKLRFLLFLFILTSINIQSQTTYFIKYKNSVPISSVDLKVTEQRFSEVVNDRPVSLPEFNVNYLAKGLGRGDDVLGRIVKIQFSENMDEANFSSMLSSDSEIEYIQKSTTYKMDFVPNDSLVSQQWALEKIKAFDAWNITQGVDTVLLAIIDTGIEYFHLDLQNKIYYNPSENGLDQLGNDKSSNGIDDDNNGFIDDYMGWDFVDRVGFPSDTLAGDFLDWDNIPYDNIKGSLGNHGTLVGGTVGAEANNISGVAGVAPNIQLLNIRSFDNDGSGEEDDAAAAILYAVQMGAKIINMSWGDVSFSFVLRDVIRYAYSQNVVLVASSGNSGSNTPHYPSGYSEIISVGNSTEEDFVSGNSNWGSTLDLVAPGSSIKSTDVDLGYTDYSGTSAAAPHVSAAAALILSVGNFTNEEVKQIIKSTCDDIGEPGWDLHAGAGRLNLFKALSVLAPAIVKFNFPTMDYATNGNSIEINATILSPYFVSYNLQVGSGYNPDQWTTLIGNGRNQFTNEIIYNLDISSFSDNVYTLRLVVFQNNGGTLEERVNYHIMRTPPEVEEVGLGPLYYGERSTIAGEFLTSQPSVMRLYYRKFGESDFNFVTLDGFNTNNQFVKTKHYGFIPKEIIQPSTLYEVYFEAENLAGLKTIVVDSANNNGYFQIPTEKLPEPRQHNAMPFSLINGITLFQEPVSFLSKNNNEVLFQPFRAGNDVIFFNYALENNEFITTESDSLLNRFPLIYGDFNNNGLKDIVAINFENIIFLEQTQSGSFSFIKKDSTTKLFYPILIDDLVNDGNYYLISENETKIKTATAGNDSLLNRYLLWKVNQDLTTTLKDSTFYIAKIDAFGSNYTTRNMLINDLDNDGIKEIWFLDVDGDLKSFKVNSNLTFTKSDSFYTSGLSVPNQQNILSIGDYDGDGKKDLAVLYKTNSIAPTFFILIISFENHNPRIISQKVFLDQSEEYGGGLSTGADLYQSLKFVDIDNDETDELIVNMFPYSYIFKYSNQEDKIIFYTEGSNTQNVFVSDLNQNGVNEICFKINNEFKFLEFTNSNRTPIPVNFSGFSISSNNISLSWNSSAEKYFIYKGTEQNNLSVVDSISQPEYSDIIVADSTVYYYAIQAYDQSKPEPFSGLSKIIEVYSHTPAKPVNAVSNSNSSVIVTFSEKMKNVIENLQSFNIPGVGFPNSVSPNNQYSYLLSFRDNLPTDTLKLIVNDIKDLYNSPITTDTLSFVIILTPEVETFYISSFEIINPFRIKLIFNFNVDETAAAIKENYLFEPENHIASVETDKSNKKVIYLNLDGKRPIGSIGREYRLRVINLRSSPETGGLTINSGAGSYIVLTSFAEDLSDVYVYPNPANIDKGKVTFANLPKRAKIVIFSLNGEKINEVEETDGNGGVDFNLKAATGEILGSGVYIYRIVMLDDTNNEVDEKIGKFAVIR
jgi:subtilisin family serine protease